MAFCSNCGNRLEPEAKFCNKCGTRIITDNQISNTERKLEYQGTVVKCPSCGAEVPAMAAICPDCGHEFNSVNVSDSLNKFIQEINELDNRIANEPKEKNGWNSWSLLPRFLWVLLNIYTICIPILYKKVLTSFSTKEEPELSDSERQKSVLINNYTLPPERSLIIEYLRFIQGRIKKISESSVSGNDLYWANVWNTKASEIRDQADLIIPNEPLIDTINEKIDSSLLTINRKVRKKKVTRILLLILTTFLALCLFVLKVRSWLSK